jgi:hypothetical protein
VSAYTEILTADLEDLRDELQLAIERRDYYCEKAQSLQRELDLARRALAPQAYGERAK